MDICSKEHANYTTDMEWILEEYVQCKRSQNRWERKKSTRAALVSSKRSSHMLKGQIHIMLEA